MRTAMTAIRDPLKENAGEPSRARQDDSSGTPPEGRLLTTLQQLLDITTTDLAAALTEASDVMAAALAADKVDVFLYDESRDSLVAVGSSTQPLSNLQKRLGLDVLPLSNGGRAVAVYRTARAFLTGAADEDAEELRGIREGLGIRSQICVPLQVGEERRGALLITSRTRDFFTAADARFAERQCAGWVRSLTTQSSSKKSDARPPNRAGERRRKRS